MGAFHVHTIQGDKGIGARLPETPSLGRKVRALPLSAGASFDKQVHCEQVADGSLYFDMERTRVVPRCCQVGRAKCLFEEVGCSPGTCRGSPELAGWEHVHLKHSEPSS